MNASIALRRAMPGAVLALLLAAAPAYPSSPATPGFQPAGVETAEQVSPLRIEINVPAYRLDAFVDGERVATYPVTIGKRWEPTDPGHHQIRTVIWNPWWHPPANRRPKDKVTPPGPRNPMGRVKLNLRGMYYIHGTALDDQIGRAMSRGCVRMRNEDAVALAQLVHRYAGPDLGPGALEALVRDPRRTRHLKLAMPVDVQIVYRLAEVRDDRLEIHEDVYRIEARPLADLAAAALAESGVPSERLDREALAAALEDKPAEGLPVHALLLPEGGVPAGDDPALAPVTSAARATSTSPAGR